MKNILCLSICLLLCLFSDAQTQIITGEVIDATTQQRIPYVSILLKTQQNGTTTNAQGFFKLEIPSNNERDSISFSCLNYQKVNITIQELLLKKGKIALIPISYELSEVVVRGNPVRTEKLGVYQKKSNSTLLCRPGNQVAVLIKCNSNVNNKLKKVGYFIKQGDKPKTPFRIRIYESTADSMPDKDLLTENLIVAAEKKGWFWYDVSKYNISIPKHGIFIAMEWIFTSDDNYWIRRYYMKGEKRPREDKLYGQTIGLTDKSITSITRFKHNKWFEKFISDNANAMFAAEVDFYE